jgi:hypothetical protein
MRRTVGVWLLAILLAIGQPLPASAGCNIDDLRDHLDEALKSFTNGKCAEALDNPVAATLTLALFVAVGGIGSEDRKSKKSFCDAVNDANNWTQDAQQDLTNFSNRVKQIDPEIASKLQGAIDQAQSTLTDVAGVEASFICACSVTSGVSDLFDDVGQCVKDALCFLQGEIFGDDCSGNPPRPVPSSCFLQPCDQNGQGKYCDPNPICIDLGSWGAFPFQCNGGPTGVIPANASVCAYAARNGPYPVCLCPPPMHYQKLPNDISAAPNACSAWDRARPGYLACVCPPGTQLQPKTEAGTVPVCICDGTKRPAVANDPSGKICPDCYNGQVKDPKTGKCVDPCLAPKIRLDSGKCCLPLQTTSCGECCPDGQIPDPTGTKCITPPPQIIK